MCTTCERLRERIAYESSEKVRRGQNIPALCLSALHTQQRCVVAFTCSFHSTVHGKESGESN